MTGAGQRRGAVQDGGRLGLMRNLYSNTKGQQAIRQLALALDRRHALTIAARGERKDEAGELVA